MGSAAPAVIAPLDSPIISLCDLGFVTEVEESAGLSTTTNLANMATLCDVSFITELMECDFSHQPHLEQHHHSDKQLVFDALHDHYDAIDVDCVISSEHPHCHHQKMQCFAHGNDDLDIHQATLFHVQDAYLHTQVHDCANRESYAHDVDNEGGLHSHAHHCGKHSLAFPGESGSNSPSTQALQGSNSQEQHDGLQPGHITGSQTEDSLQRPICSSDGSDSEDASLGFSLDVDIAGEGVSTPSVLEKGAINEQKLSDAEHFEGSHEKTQESNLNLLHLLLASAEAVSNDNFELASVILSRLQELSCEYGSSLQRLSFYLSDALVARIMPSSKAALQQSLCVPLSPCDMLEAFCVFYNVNPIGRFCHLTLNQLILDNTLTDTAIHLVDLHIGYGMQWAAFLYAAALRPCGPPKLRLTGIGSMEETLISTGKKLVDMANSLQVSFEFCPIVAKLQELDVGMVSIREDEVCVISSLGQLHTLLHKGSNYVDAFLAGLRLLNPKVLVLAENDVDHNNPLFLNRFVECMKYYAAVFESLDAALPPTSQARLKIESLLCGRKIGSIVACEGIERVERHETMHDWMKRMERVGFRNAEVTHAAINQAKLLLNIYYPNGYSLTEEGGEALTLRWNGAALMAIGIWH